MRRRPESDAGYRIVLLGGGAHAVVVAETLRAAGQAKLVGYVDCQGHDPIHMKCMKVPCLGTDDQLEHLVASGGVNGAVIALAGLEHGEKRRWIADRLEGVVPRWCTTIHPTAAVAESAVVGDGTVVFAHAAINPLARIGRHAVINTSAIVEHHCQVEEFAVISPRATLCGQVRVGGGAFVGAGAVIVGEVTVGPNAVIGAGAVVLEDVPPGAVVAGNPARLIKTNQPERADLVLAP
ncbi:MAG: NeuD/PglB/VioB family sugar acetyltransferase [Phycisphaerae bacterium]